MRAPLIGLVCLLTGASTSLAQPATGHAITNPDWARRPTAEDVSHHYPRLAAWLSLEGRATISCMVEVSGRLADCKVADEAPAGLGFGAAARDMSVHFEMRPKTLAGVPVTGGTVRIPIRFTLPAVDPHTPPPRASEARLAPARRLVKARGVDAFAIQRLETGVRRLEFTGGDAMPRATREAGVDALKAALAARRAEVAEAYANAYALVLTEEELAVLAAYAEGPTARAFAGGGPARDMLPLILASALQSLRTHAREGYCADAPCMTPADLASAWRPEKPTRRGKPRLTDPQWIGAPSLAQLRSARPQGATILNLPGAVRMGCRLTADGGLESCQVEEEHPAGAGFGEKALGLAGRYRLHPFQVRMLGAGDEVLVRLGFPEDEVPEPFEPPLPRSPETLELARRLITAFDAKAQLEAAMASYKPTAEVESAHERMVAAALIEALPATVTAVETAVAGVFATFFTETQLREAIRHQESAVGQAEIARREALNEALAQAWTDVGVRINADARAAFCAERACGPSPEPAKIRSDAAPAPRTPSP
ncbi:TonB family protein [Phenylobacterium sp.]|uniref:TonB family protein n=1 Tax=Phenylobacterium sp. TaxID=1871053 RepID=UPI00301C1D92